MKCYRKWMKESGITWKKQRRYAHRVAYEIASGIAVPPDLLVCHKCDNPRCVRADHLFLGTPKDNVRDAMTKGRMRLTGRANPNARLTAEHVQDILKRAHRGNYTALAREYGVHLETVRALVHAG